MWLDGRQYGSDPPERIVAVSDFGAGDRAQSTVLGDRSCRGRLAFTNREPTSRGGLLWRFRRYSPLRGTAHDLNRCHRFRGFVYEHARFSNDKTPCDPAKVRPQSARAAICRRPGTINSPSAALSSSLCGGFFVLPAVRDATRRLPPLLPESHP